MLTLACFWRVWEGDFVKFDDQVYVLDNAMVTHGLTGQGVAWAFTPTGYAANYHPLTWLSLMADVSLHGVNPAWFHATNLIFHICNVVLLYWFLQRMTRSPWRSLLVASVFAIHPLRVESVAWISERKDVLSMFFGFLALLAYVNYARRPNVWRYLAMTLLLVLSLLSKPMLVTFPFLLFLLDFWPLGRVVGWPAQGALVGTAGFSQSTPRRLMVEKLPLLALIAASSVMTYWVQHLGRAMEAGKHFTLPQRLANAIVAYGWYPRAVLWPVNLGALYPMPVSGWPVWLVLATALLLAGVTVLVCRQARRRPWLAVGWLWYLGLLLPVIGLVQVGGQSMADRYTYLPTVGLLIMAAWSLPALIFVKRAATIFLCAGWVVLLILLGALTHQQVGYWHDSETLFRHTLAVTRDNWWVESGLGAVLAARGQRLEAIDHFHAALAIDPQYVDARLNLGMALRNTGHPDQAMEQYRLALQNAPNNAELHNDLGIALSDLGQWPQAAEQFERAIALDTGNPSYRANLGQLLISLGRYSEAAANLHQALEMNPVSQSANMGLGMLAMKLHQPQEAARYFAALVELAPGRADARVLLAEALDVMGQRQAVMDQLRAAIELRPTNPSIQQRIERLARKLDSERQSETLPSP